VKTQVADKKMVACVACGRVLVASKNGHPRKHAPTTNFDRKNPGRSRTNMGYVCDGTYMPGVEP
jgi:hypothetical protein